MKKSIKRINIVSIFTGLTVMVLSNSLIAAEERVIEFDDLTVTSTTIDDRFENKRTEPSNIAVISGEEVDKEHTENIQQMLQSIPGVTTELQSGDSLKIHIRGVENQRYMGEKPGVAIVIDGVPVFERTGRVNIDMDNIESIKVIKGGASYLFGEDALAGAVIITTKRGAKHAGFKVGAETGTFGYKKQLVRAGHSGENFNGHIQASSRESDGYHFDSDYEADYLNGKLQYYVDDMSDLTLGFEQSDREKDSHGTVEGVTQAEEDPKSKAGRDYTRMYDVDLAKYTMNYSRDTSAGGNLMVSLYQFEDETEFVSAPQKYDAAGNPVTDVDAYTTANDYEQEQRGLKSEYRSSAGKLAWMGAVDLRDNTYENKRQYIVDFKRSPFSPTVYTAGTQVDDNETDEEMEALYGEIKFSPREKLVLTLNGRYDRIDLDYKDNLNNLSLDKTFHVDSWRLGANYNVRESLDFYANVSTGFRRPTVTQLFSGSISPFGDTENNTGLDPEESYNYEVGVRGKTELLKTALDYDMAIFQIDREDFIMSSSGNYSIPQGGQKDRFENIGDVRNRGLELSVTSDANQMFSFDLAYTYLNAKYTKYDNLNLILGSRYVPFPTIVQYDVSNNEVPRTPHHHLNLSLMARLFEGFLATLEWDKISAYYADDLNQHKINGHSVYNLLLNYQLKQSEKVNWSFFARVDNLFDRDYWNTARTNYDRNADGTYDREDLSIVVNPGRRYTAGVSVNF